MARVKRLVPHGNDDGRHLVVVAALEPVKCELWYRGYSGICYLDNLGRLYNGQYVKLAARLRQIASALR